MATEKARRRNWTRRRRYAAVFAPSLVIGLGWSFLTAQGAFAASLHVAGLKSTITADTLVGKGFAQYGWVDAAKENADAGIPGLIPIARTGIVNAELTNLCQSVTIDALNVTLVIRAGTEPKRPVKATNLVIDMTELSGDAAFDNIDIGGDASELSKAGPDFQGPQNMFSQEADVVRITDLKQTAYATSAGTFLLRDLDLRLKSGTTGCA